MLKKGYIVYESHTVRATLGIFFTKQLRIPVHDYDMRKGDNYEMWLREGDA